MSYHTLNIIKYGYTLRKYNNEKQYIVVENCNYRWSIYNLSKQMT